MNTVYYIALGVIALWNIIVFCLFGIDKHHAKTGKRRIHSRTLLVISFALGGIGALFGMAVFHHKIRYLRFQILVSISTVITFAAIIFILSQTRVIY